MLRIILGVAAMRNDQVPAVPTFLAASRGRFVR